MTTRNQKKTKLEIGKIVRLKSGGPKMTVVMTQSDGLVRCNWFTGVDCCEVYNAAFPVETLQVINR